MHRYLKDWCQHRGAAQAELRVRFQEINNDTIQIQSRLTPKTLDLHCNESIFILLRVRVTLFAQNCMAVMNTLSEKTAILFNSDSMYNVRNTLP
jgi:hypothetical protein